MNSLVKDQQRTPEQRDVNSLVKDQQHTLEQRGVKVASTYNLDAEKIEKIKQGYYEVIYFSPETILTNSDWRDIWLENLVGLVIDEAHCVRSGEYQSIQTYNL